LIDANKPADLVTVAEALELFVKLDDTGGLAYLAALAQNTPSAANIRRYAEMVRERAVLRKLVCFCYSFAHRKNFLEKKMLNEEIILIRTSRNQKGMTNPQFCSCVGWISGSASTIPCAKRWMRYRLSTLPTYDSAQKMRRLKL
jgi:hypothetical protein